MTQYLREQEQLRQQKKKQKQTQAYIQQKETAMMKNITQISCRMLRHCQNKEKYCMACSKNIYRNMNYPAVDYFKPKVPGLTVLP
jgi:hypothetical protein